MLVRRVFSQDKANSLAISTDPVRVPELDMIYLNGVGGMPARRFITDQTFFVEDTGEILEVHFFLYLIRFVSFILAL